MQLVGKQNLDLQNLLTWDQAMQLLGKSEPQPQLQNLLTWDQAMQLIGKQNLDLQELSAMQNPELQNLIKLGKPLKKAANVGKKVAVGRLFL